MWYFFIGAKGQRRGEDGGNRGLQVTQHFKVRVFDEQDLLCV